jgi:hypothetical protein
MPSASDKVDCAAVPDSSAEVDYAVKPTGADVVIPVDGPVNEVTEAAVEQPGTPSDADTSSASEEPTLKSPFESPKPGTVDDKGDTSLEDGEIREEVSESLVKVKDPVMVEPEALGEVEEKNGNEYEGQSKLSKRKIDINLTIADTRSEVKTAEDGNFGTKNKDEGFTGSGMATVDCVALEKLGAATTIGDKAEVRIFTNDAQTLVAAANNTDAIVQDAAVADGKDVTVAHPEISQPTRSIPPHMRPGYQRPEPQSPGLSGSLVNVANPSRHTED